MACKVKVKDTAEGKRLKKMLNELSQKKVRIGFQKGKATEDDGTDVCDVAAWNELGTEHSPSRPFLRKSVDENEAKINSFLQSQRRALINGTPAEQILKEIGIFQKDLIQEKITEGSYEPNAPSTVKRKGSSKPLIDTGRMRQSVDYVIAKKGEDDR